MKKLLFSLFAFLSLTTTAQEQSAQFRGHFEFAKIIGQRIQLGGRPLALYYYVGGDGGLLTLLGAWSGLGTETTFVNGTPNSVNMLIWYSTLDAVAADIGASCNSPQANLQFNESFTKVLQTSCTWPAEGAKSEDAMMAFWLALMGYTAPEEEYLAWRDYFRSSAFKDQSAAETVKGMALAILMNPFLILQN